MASVSIAMVMACWLGTSAFAQSEVAGPTIGLGTAAIPASACGTWAMVESTSAAALQKARRRIDSALAVPGVKGLSLRAPWTSITSDLDVYTAGQQIAQADHVAFAIRFISGQDTPPQYLGNSTLYFGHSIPLPWGAGSTATSFVPNTAFESAYSTTVQQLAAYARQNGIHVLHLPWYSGPSAEIYRGLEVQLASGYSLQNFLLGHERLVDIGMSVAGPDLSVEFPLSGTGTRSVVRPLEAYMSKTYGDHNPELLVQFNDLTDEQPAPVHPARGVNMERQMGNKGDYDWTIVYQTLVSQHSKAVEVYVQSFTASLPHAAQLRQEIASFASC